MLRQGSIGTNDIDALFCAFRANLNGGRGHPDFEVKLLAAEEDTTSF